MIDIWSIIKINHAPYIFNRRVDKYLKELGFDKAFYKGVICLKQEIHQNVQQKSTFLSEKEIYTLYVTSKFITVERKYSVGLYAPQQKSIDACYFISDEEKKMSPKKFNKWIPNIIYEILKQIEDV